VRTHCSGAATGTPESFPAPRKRAEPKAVQASAGVLRSGERVLLTRRAPGGLLGGMWELPSTPGRDLQELTRQIEERTGLCTRAGAPLGQVQHVFSHRLLTLHVVALELVDPATPPLLRERDGDARWVTRADLPELGRSRLIDKALALAGI
jgi:A/G-specific adenine glycosylase